eukprot:c25210_g1_i1.p1 GENE.c25210_g1_i1~~c25210_g1_i1.p1  ORF type:complete len:450 (+),score=50.98 c25210_g1_i1:1-1350(+)
MGSLGHPFFLPVAFLVCVSTGLSAMTQPIQAHRDLLQEMGVSNEDPSEVFDVLERLGEGSFGAVYKCARKTDGFVVAVKVMPFNFDDHAALRQEIEILKSCSHINVVAYYGTYFLEGDVWVAMDLCEGGSIKDVMQLCDRTLTEPEVATVCRDVLEGLAYMHKCRIIHRDIKAGNVLLDGTGRVKLADFGVSAQMKHTWSKRNSVIGTPYWIAPEVLKQSNYDSSADIWSLGITAIEMAEGNPPLFDLHPMRALFVIPARPPPTLTRPADWSPEFSDFLSTCLRKLPTERPTAAELLNHPFVANTQPGQLQGVVDEMLTSLTNLECDLVDSQQDQQPQPEDQTHPTKHRSTVLGSPLQSLCSRQSSDSDRSTQASMATCVHLTRANSMPRGSLRDNTKHKGALALVPEALGPRRTKKFGRHTLGAQTLKVIARQVRTLQDRPLSLDPED